MIAVIASFRTGSSSQYIERPFFQLLGEVHGGIAIRLAVLVVVI